jgi:DNA-binding response OmpR family regulator
MTPDNQIDPPCVAIVEDEPVLREEMAFQLRHIGFRVEAYENAVQLYRGLAVLSFAVVVLDIGLDGEDGLEICGYLRQHDKRTGIVFVTARAMREDRLLGLEAGADAYLTKPVDIDELALVIGRLTERAQVDRRATPIAQGDAENARQWRLEGIAEFLLAPNGTQVRLSATELQVIKTLLRKPDEVCTHRDLSIALGLLPDEYNKHRVEVIISRLRERVLRGTGLALPVYAKRGVGYFFGNYSVNPLATQSTLPSPAQRV